MLVAGSDRRGKVSGLGQAAPALPKSKRNWSRPSFRFSATAPATTRTVTNGIGRRGEKLVLGFFAEMTDFSTWLGSSWQWIGWEELTEWPDDAFYRQMLSTNRHSGANTPLMIRRTCNPGSVGGVWVRRRFDPPVEPVEGYVMGPAIAGDPKLGLSRRAVCDVLSSNQRLLIADPNYGDTIVGSAISSGQENLGAPDRGMLKAAACSSRFGSLPRITS